MIIGQSFVASCVTLVGLFASGEWKGLSGEFEEFALGKVSLFCNVISALGLPLVPVLAVFVFHDKLDGLKVISLLLAI